MRFVLAHKLSTYLMATCSFMALALSGELSAIVVILGALGIMVSWLWEPPRIRYERFTLPWNIVSLLVLAYTLLITFTGGDVLLVGATFLMYLQVAKLFNRRACKDYLHIYVISFLMLVAGTVLNSEFSYGVFFLGFVIAATWALILFHLRREMEDNFLLKHSEDLSSERVEVARILNSRRIVGRRFFAGTAVVSLTIFLVATVLFLSIPRIGFGLFFQKNRAGITMTGFRDGVRLGGHGTIKTDSTVVMRVEVEKPYQGRRAPYIHWRGVAFDYYTKGNWQRSRVAPRTSRQLHYPRSDREQHHLLYDQAPMSAQALVERAETATRQDIYLDPIGYDVLFGASMPVAFEFESRLGLRSPRTERNDELRFAHTAGIKYVVYSDIESPDPAVLRAAPKELPEGYDRYLQVPPEITPEVRNLAREITRDARTDYDKAVAVSRWLKGNLSYTLRMESPGDTEPLHFFLLDRRKGHCEYFSSAMAIMLREVGVPTRNVNGFLGGEWNEYNDYIAVRAGDAHSWVEVYFAGAGWVTFDPTPSGQIDRLGRGGSGVGERLRRLMDTMRFKWFKWVIEYDLYRQMSLFRDMREGLSGGASSVKSFFADGKAWISRHGTVLGGALLAALAILLALAWRKRNKAMPPGSTERQARTRAPMSALYNQVLNRLARRGHRRKPPVTPREYARALCQQNVPGAAHFEELTELYYQAIYGEMTSPDPLPRARALSAAIDKAFQDARRAAKKAESRTGSPGRSP